MNLSIKKCCVSCSKIIILISLILFSHNPLWANTGILSCEGERVGGNPKTFKVKKYKRITPTLIFNSGKKKIIFVYTEHGMKWETKFNILKEDDGGIFATFNYFGSMETDIFYFNKENKTYSWAYVGKNGNTMNYGRCYE